MLRRVEPPSFDPNAPPRPPNRLRVFAVEPTAIQVDWSRLGPGPVRVRAADTTRDIVADGGPGAIVLDDLPASSAVTIRFDGEGMAGEAVELVGHTLAHPPGAEIFRLGAITDLHIGVARFGKAGTLTERPRPAIPHPIRCAGAATDAAQAWGAELILAKGDLTESSRPHHWTAVADLFARAEVPMLISPGNHEAHRKNTVDPVTEAARHGLTVLRSSVEATDHPGIRIIRGDTAIPETDQGRIEHIADGIFDLAASTDQPVILAVHHHFERWRHPIHPPPGIPGPESRHFLDRLSAVQPRTLITSGHTHRHRMRAHGPLVLAETGSTKDYPGTWTGYVVHEGGIRQVVRRIDEPSCIRWTEWTARAAFGLWRHWSPGTLDERCFSHRWPEAGS